ncbi:MAG: site-specific DNA-methyltransferase [Acidobacteria bacterium]|nr:site-specific DNA-methyltransferase [Acidobacteriota bacterium]
MEKLKMHSIDVVEDNLAKLADLFPDCITETRDENGNIARGVDFDHFRQAFSSRIVEGPQERYQLNWPGKREALLTANAPIAKTLRPCREESVDFDTTKNLYIEGDNLDALKLLQETYLGKVKMIYIDPPYNTGKDFIYEDDFAEDKDAYFERSMQVDEEGNRLVANSESNGRFHSDWLRFIYSRIKLSWNLLADDGIIAVTIDDGEVFQFGKVLDEIFGPGNRLACAPWLSEASGGKEKSGLRTGHEYLLLYFKRSSESISQEERSTGELNLRDSAGPYRKGRELMKWGGTSLRSDRPNQFYPLQAPDGTHALPYRNDGKEGHWRWGKENPEILKAFLGQEIFHWEKRPFDDSKTVNGETERWVPYEKIRDIKKSVGWSTWLDKYGTNADATRELKDLFGFKPFDTPKPTSLINWVISLHGDDDCIVVDYFSGSASTAHAVLKANADDHGTRKFIMIQLPELCPDESPAQKAGYKTIADIGKERIRRAGQKVKEEAGLNGVNLDIGFRVLKIDSSNMKDVYYSPDTAEQASLLDQIGNVKEDRTPEDLLFQVMLDWGVDLSLPIMRQQWIMDNGQWTISEPGATEDIGTESSAGTFEVFFVDENALACCFDDGVSEDLIKELAKRQPLRAVFRDSGFASDDAKINAEQIFKQMSPGTEVRSI